MGSAPSILAFSGSLREGSLNTKLVRQVAAGARAAGASITFVSLKELSLPLYDEDLESSAGLPDAVRRFKDLLRAHDGMLIASPEHNGSLSSALKNAIDWASRPEKDHPPLSCFQGKVAGIVSASPGALGGLQGLVHLRQILSKLMVLVLPEQFGLMKAHEAFGPDGEIRDEKQRALAMSVGARVASVASRLRA